jgi:hypothetical protein
MTAAAFGHLTLAQGALLQVAIVVTAYPQRALGVIVLSDVLDAGNQPSDEVRMAGRRRVDSASDHDVRLLAVCRGLRNLKATTSAMPVKTDRINVRNIARGVSPVKSMACRPSGRDVGTQVSPCAPRTDPSGRY